MTDVTHSVTTMALISWLRGKWCCIIGRPLFAREKASVMANFKHKFLDKKKENFWRGFSKMELKIFNIFHLFFKGRKSIKDKSRSLLHPFSVQKFPVKHISHSILIDYSRAVGSSCIFCPGFPASPLLNPTEHSKI